MVLLRSALVLVLVLGGQALADLPRTDLSYRIRVRVDPGSRRIEGRETLRWTNRSGRPVQRVPIHLYLNAFSNLGSTWMREAGVYFSGWFDRDRFLEQYPDPWGWIEPGPIQQIGMQRPPLRARWRAIQPDDGNPLDRTLIEVELPRAVPPGETLELQLTFAGRLPVPMARTGCTPDFCMVAQWFPKIGVMQRGRWVARQFHAPTEFFADFADYDVTIEAPRGWTVGATGRQVAGETVSPRFTQRAVHDFAIVLGRTLHDVRTVYTPAGATPIHVRYLLPQNVAHQALRARHAIERTLDLFARRVGPYPYDTLTVVLPPWRARRTGGMEYPTLITGSPADPLWDHAPLSGFRAPEFTLVHELGHQYFYGLLASNEQEAAMLDEGFNSHWDGEGMQALFGTAGSAGWVLGRSVDAVEFYASAMDRDAHRIHEPMRRRPSWLFYPGTQRDQIYGRGALTLWTARRLLGRHTFDRIFAAYYGRFRFRHPDVDDFLQVANETDPRAAAFFAEAFTRQRVPDYRVVSLTSQPFQAPLGHVVDNRGVVQITRDNQLELRRRFTTSHMTDAQDRVWVQIHDPGWARGGHQIEGTIRWHGFRRGHMPDAPRGVGDLHHSRARIVGPAWDHLPVTVLLRFEDGVEIRERWDGRAAWRAYHVVRAAPLQEVRIDESQRIALDVRPQNNALSRRAHRRFVADWGGWLTAVVQWLASGVSLWL